MWWLSTRRQQIRRVGLISVVLVVCVGGASVGIERWSAVAGWGRFFLSCRGVSMATVERVSGIDLPDGAVLLSATGDHDGGFLAKQTVNAVVRMPAGDPLPIETGPDASGCLGQPKPNPFKRWGAIEVRFREVYGSCQAVGTLADGAAVVHIVGVRRLER